ncbi:energy transducer TonB [Sphingomonas sp. HITSZ_GF]|uniref:energy transducer TonB n=1 Tax=Sphingomonas sp. HITSZ_GF TaxID=3037247 RepID=UPI00240E00BC|nr:energy transducer TonB [Sphingomonas sp. HITSZ_GF]MDG2535916.1 energy transducer TonB [Sphingomonas sp. HITSZ_GF]
MSRTVRLTLVLGTAIALVQAAHAQEAQRLPEVTADAEKQTPAYERGEGVDSGTTRIGEAEVKARAPGSGDAMQLLKVLPTVQFSREEFLATRENIQDIRPADISISGGRIYDNLFTMDGVDVSARVETAGERSSENPFALHSPESAISQSLWVDTNLVGAIVVRDSNVSAEYGRFTGGAVDVQTRAPRSRFGGSTTVSYTSDWLTSFKVSDEARTRLAGNFPERPSFEKIRFGATLDVPITDTIQTLFAYNRSQSDVVYSRGANYGSTPFGQRSRSENFMGKINAEFGDLRVTGQATYTPYTSQASQPNGYDNQVTSQGGGVTGQLGLEMNGKIDWSVRASYTHSNTGREASPINYSIPSSTTNGAVCVATSCTIGGFGDLNQTQDNYQLNARASTDLWGGTLAGGIDLQRIDGMRERPVDGYAYLTNTTVARATIVCAAGDSMSCVTGQYALLSRQMYSAYRANVSMGSAAGWLEYHIGGGGFDTRIGVRYDYEEFLGNHNFAPRLTTSYTVPGTRWKVTAGVNRYYGRSMFAYALREKLPATIIERRVPVLTNGQNIVSENWAFGSASRTTYANKSTLKTPRSDEISANVSGPIFGGTLTLRGVYRRGENEFNRSEVQVATMTLPNGRVQNYNEYVLNNDGFSRYRGGSIEWQRTFGKHTVALSTNFSKTKTSNTDYIEDASDLIDDTVVAYKGQLLTYSQLTLLSQREDFATPFMVNGTLTSRWWHDRITTNLNLRYRDPFQMIMQDGTTTIDGVRYDNYDLIRVPASVEANMNIQAELLRNELGALTLDVRIANLLDSIPVRNATATTQPYQYGRSFWTGLTFRF